MGATYTRQSTYEDGDTITADHTNNEFDQLLAAFAASTGHTHDGTAGEGGPITKLATTSVTIGDGTAGTDITVTFDGESNDGVLTWNEDLDYFEFSDDLLIASTEKIQFGTTANYINSGATNHLDLVAGAEIHLTATDINIDGAADISGNLGVGGNLTVTGTTTFNGGTITMGDAATDNVVFGADVNSSIIPNTDDTYDLGSTSQQWRNLFIDGTAEVDVLSIAGTAVTSTATELNLLHNVSGLVQADLTKLAAVDASATELNILTNKAFLDEDNFASNSATGIASQQSIKAYVDEATAASITSTGALDSGSITSGFGTIDTGVSAITTTGLISGGSLDIDNVLINGTTIGHTDDTDLITLANGVVTVAGEVSVTTLDIGGTNVTSTATELNLLDGSSANSVVNSKAVIYGSSGELAGALSTAAQTNVTSLGTLTALTVDDVAIDGKAMTMTGSSSDTAVFTVGTNGTLSIVTTDDAAAAANIQITADGTAELAGTTVTLDSGGDIDLAATNDVNLPANVGLTFGNDGEKIEGDGTNLAINSSGDLNVTATTIDIDGNVEISGTAVTTGVHTFTAVPVFPNDTVETADIQADAITGAKIADDAINSEHYTDGSIDTAHIADANITTAKIADVNVTQGKIANEAINEAKLQVSNAPTNGYFLTAQSGNTGGLTWAELSGIPTYTRSTTAPGSPSAGDWWLNTTSNQPSLFLYDGTLGWIQGDATALGVKGYLAGNSFSLRINKGGPVDIIRFEPDDLLPQIQFDFVNSRPLDGTSDAHGIATTSNTVRCVMRSGANYTSDALTFLVFANLANATVFGDHAVAQYRDGAISHATRGIFVGGAYGGASNVMQYITIATEGNSADFGDLTVARYYHLDGCVASTVRGIILGGWTASASGSNIIDYVTIDTAGNATDFGDLTEVQSQVASAHSTTRGIRFGGLNNTTVIDYITMDTAGNATDFGDLAQSNPGNEMWVVHNGTYAWMHQGYSVGIKYKITMATAADATVIANNSIAAPGHPFGGDDGTDILDNVYNSMGKGWIAATG